MKLAEDENGKLCALKVTRKNPKTSGKKHWDLFYNEVNALKKLTHPHILNMLDYSEDSIATRPDGSKIEVIYTALEYVENGEIFDYISETGKFSEPEARYFFHQLMDALEYIHDMGFAHRDIKPENLLLDKNFDLKLADFGFATNEKTSTSRKGTFGYMAPEVISNQEYVCTDADIYGSAVVLFILATQHPPFLKAEPSDKYFKKIYDGRWDRFWEIHADEHLSDSFIDLLTKMLALNPKERLSLDEIKLHEWFNGPVPKKEDIIQTFTKRKEIIDEKEQNKQKLKQSQANSANSSVQKKNRKLTQFYEVKDGDELLDILIKFASDRRYKYEKSKEYFRAQFVAEEMGHEVCIQANVLKKPNSVKR